jgi:hypothetical protein
MFCIDKTIYRVYILTNPQCMHIVVTKCVGKFHNGARTLGKFHKGDRTLGKFHKGERTLGKFHKGR